MTGVVSGRVEHADCIIFFFSSDVYKKGQSNYKKRQSNNYRIKGGYLDFSHLT